MVFADLEIGLHRRDSDSYAVDLRFTMSDREDDTRLPPGEEVVARFDPDALDRLAARPAEYGAALTESLFASPVLRTTFARARAAAQSQDAILRLRLFIGASAPELHSLRWETLRDPEGDGSLLMSDQILFSRYLSSGDWQPVRLRPKGDLKALIIVANPSDLEEYNLAPVDAPGELARALAGLAGIPTKVIAPAGSEVQQESYLGAATLGNIIEQMRDGYDIIYLVAHGAVVLGEPYLWLEQKDGTVDQVKGARLLERISELRARPRMMVLASCQSAGAGGKNLRSDDGALAAFGPRLAEAGVPVVLAHQGNISMETVARFMPTFFKEVQRDGQVDQAMARARGDVRDRADYWIPVLFMRLRSGRIWYVPGFGEGQEASFEKWPAFVNYIRKGQCTPVIGNLTEALLGSSQEIARKWSEKYHFPMAPHEREDLPHVAQYLSVNQDWQYPRSQIVDYMRSVIVSRYSAVLPADVTKSDADIIDLYNALGEYSRQVNEADPYKVLAEMPFPIYITTNTHNLLSGALRAAKKDPVVELCRWNKDLEQFPSIYEDDPDYQPSPERPLVFHLFGVDLAPESLVLTEDDYFDFLLGAKGNNDLIPIPVREALADSALLFLGFRLEDWDFRVLFRGFMDREGGSRRKRYTHVAAQFVPEEGRFLEPDRARKYLESYFRDADINIYWGSVEDFMQDLLKQSRVQSEKTAPERKSLRRF